MRLDFQKGSGEELMELRHLKTFHVVSGCLNFTKAADILKYSQPTISLQIKALEEEVGHALLNRVGKKMFLTPAGKLLQEHTNQVFGLLDELEWELKKLEKPSGNLTIAAPEFYCGYYLSHILASYLKIHPQVNLKLICSNSKETHKLVSSNRADIGFIAGTYGKSGVEEMMIDQEDLILVANPSIVKNQSLQEMFDEYPFITYGIEKDIQDCLNEIECTPKTIVECGSEEAIKRAVMSQAGIALLSDLIIKKEVQQGTLQVLYRFPKRLTTHLIYPQNVREFSNVSTFISLATDMWQSIRNE